MDYQRDLVRSNSAIGKIIMTTELMAISDSILDSVVAVVVQLSCCVCCGLGRDDSSRVNNINAATIRNCLTLSTELQRSVISASQFSSSLFLQPMIVYIVYHDASLMTFDIT